MKTGLLIRELRKKKEWTMDDLSAKTGISKSLISNFENGTEPSKSKLEIIAKAFEVPISYFDGNIQENSEKSTNSERFEELSSTVDFLKTHIEALMEEKKELMKMLELALKGNFPVADLKKVVQISDMRLAG